MNQDAKEKLNAAAVAISSAVLALKLEMPTMVAFLEECRHMESFGHIVDPTLYRDPERRAVSAVVQPLFEAAVAFVRAHDAQVAKASRALAAVGDRDDRPASTVRA